jgi:tRNA-binding protein
MTAQITYADFEKVDVRVGIVVAVEDFPKARKPAYKLTVDFGPLGVKRSSAQITVLYPKEHLLGRQVLAVVNLAPRQIADFVSEVLILGIADSEGTVILLSTEREARTGSRVS